MASVDPSIAPKEEEENEEGGGRERGGRRGKRVGWVGGGGVVINTRGHIWGLFIYSLGKTALGLSNRHLLASTESIKVNVINQRRPIKSPLQSGPHCGGSHPPRPRNGTRRRPIVGSASKQTLS